jgi:glycosyltransferase involved in cell wall biosynthesis
MIRPQPARRDATAIACVICTVGRPDIIARAVGSVLTNTYDDFEAVVVDQSADTSTRDALEPLLHDPRLRYIHTNRKGLSRAYNIGIAATSAPIIAFTDDDCVADTGWLAAIELVFAQYPDVDMLYGQTLAPIDGDPGSVVPDLSFAEPRILGRGHTRPIIGMGANFALRRSLMAKVGPFDETLGGGAPLRSSQDFDFQYRAYRAGALIRLSPEVNVDHFGARTRGEEWTRTLNAYGIGDGAFYWKHVRCGDVTALRMLVQRMGKLLLREAINPVRRRSSHWPYITACWHGLRESMKFEVDRKSRLYISGEQTTQ